MPFSADETIKNAIAHASLPSMGESVEDVIEDAIRLGITAGSLGRVAVTDHPLDKDVAFARDSLVDRIETVFAERMGDLPDED